MNKGQIIFLNGTSSSGKTTIAKALQECLAEPYLLVSVDDFFNMLPEKYLDPDHPEAVNLLPRLVSVMVSGFHGAVAALAQSGNPILVDHVLQEDGWLQDCVEKWKGLDVLFVGVKCPLAVAEQRERERGDRNPGTARYQFDRVHRHGVYDVEIDTSVLTVDACVARIMAAVENRPEPPAFAEFSAGSLLAGEARPAD